MTTFEQFFDGNLFVINLARRPDRMANFEAEMAKIGVTTVERFEAIDAGKDLGNHGCCASHRALLSLIVERGIERAFVFEDDSIVRPQFVDDFHREVVRPLEELPTDWDIIYLGAGYGEKPQGWHSPHLIRVNGMKTTSSYGITAKAAKELRDLIPEWCGCGIDDIFSSYTPAHRAFVSEPRLFVQYENYSDLQKSVLNNGASMEDTFHVKQLGCFRSK